MKKNERDLGTPRSFRSRKKRQLGLSGVFVGVGGAVVLGCCALLAVSVGKQIGAGVSGGAATASQAEAAAISANEESLAAAAEAERAAAAEEVVASYQNLGIVQASSYVNIRKEPDGDVIGKLSGDGACEILGVEGDWTHITSGGVEGYISSQYLLTGEEARQKALGLVKKMAIIQVEDSLNIRQTPEALSDWSNVVGQALNEERYEVLGEENGWIQIPEGYISAEYAQVRYALNEGRKVDLKSMVLNMYDNLVISKVDHYLNVRSSPENKGDENIIGKMTSKAAGEILETVDGWYKVRSGPITGYISADPQYTATGQEAKDLAVQNAELKAIIKTDVLNVRTEPNTDAKIWTQIVKDERYAVVGQLDGWVQIELDSVDEEDGNSPDGAYISTRDNNVEVRYALNEAIKFSPAKSGGGSGSTSTQSRRSKVVNFALQYVGNPYVWGGTSLTRGVDCSGFTMQVMRQFGVSLPHYSVAQSKMGRAVKSSEMKPGDLIFYAGSGGRVNHVALYIGNGQVVHAASKRSGIKISTWNYRTPVAIRNVLGD